MEGFMPEPCHDPVPSLRPSLRGVSGASEVHYSHRRWTKSRPLAKLKGLNLTAVAWGRITDKVGGVEARVRNNQVSDKGFHCWFGLNVYYC